MKKRAGIAQWLERRSRDRKVGAVAVVGEFSSPGSTLWWENFLLQGQLWLIFRDPFHSRVTAVACKRSWSLCQKCRWQVTAKHACTLRMHVAFMKWHGAWLYGVHRTLRDGSSFMRQHCKYTTSVDSQKRAIYKCKSLIIVSCRITCERSESARERRIALYESEQQEEKEENYFLKREC